MRLRTLFPRTLGFLVLASSAWAAPPADIEARVRGFVEASNRQDVEAMVAAVDPDFRWLQVDGERIQVEVVGAEQLRSWLQGYFRSTPGARSRIGEVLVDGNYATTVEQVEFRDGEGRLQRQSSTSVYQFDSQGRILKVWYFPAQSLLDGEASA